jgi:hypothetical protein
METVDIINLRADNESYLHILERSTDVFCFFFANDHFYSTNGHRPTFADLNEWKVSGRPIQSVNVRNRGVRGHPC